MMHVKTAGTGKRPNEEGQKNLLQNGKAPLWGRLLERRPGIESSWSSKTPDPRLHFWPTTAPGYPQASVWGAASGAAILHERHHFPPVSVGSAADVAVLGSGMSFPRPWRLASAGNASHHHVTLTNRHSTTRKPVVLFPGPIARMGLAGGKWSPAPWPMSHPRALGP